MTIPDGWIDDMNVKMKEGVCVNEIVRYVIDSSMSGMDSRGLMKGLVDNFGIAEGDVDLVVDRVHGGVVRAATDDSENRPNKKDDPVAWESYWICKEDKEIIYKLYPNYRPVPNTAVEVKQPAPQKTPWWKIWKIY